VLAPRCAVLAAFLGCLLVSRAGPEPTEAPAVVLPPSFPEDEYTPHGYLDNPYHSAVANRSGIIRSVPPLGFGYWCRRLPWPYGEGALRSVNYLSLLHLSIDADGARFHTADDFEANGVKLASTYHTKTLFSYDWQFRGLSFSARYFLPAEDSLACLLEIANTGSTARVVTAHATHIHGFPERRWWGADGVTARHVRSADAAISKIWAYGDVFVLGADRPSTSHKFTGSEAEWTDWITANDLTSRAPVRVAFPDHLYSVQSYRLDLPARSSTSIRLSLSRGVSEQDAIATHESSLKNGLDRLRAGLAGDERFYQGAPLLVGDWAPEWKRGWVYDWETLRMTIRPPVGIYKHPWDGMQVYTPRLVLGETALDTMCLSYADAELAKRVLHGTFADSAPNVPCTREDGSVNMICADGSEAGTAPIWGLPFRVIRSIYLRDGDARWIGALYPHLKKFLEWWLQNRTDKQGWFHSKCSWESGQDASKRFLVATDDPGAVADFVRTVDIEAAMAEAMTNMALFARVAGRTEDSESWTALAADRIARTRGMFVDGWFRDFDARTGEPIILKSYYDVMMLTPAATGIATADQMAQLAPMFGYFQENPKHWLEWPAFVFVYTEAAWNAGLRALASETVFGIGNRIYSRWDARATRPVGRHEAALPSPYNYRIPGVANEFWPLELEADNPGGAEHYGWGATLPAMIIRNVIGFREQGDGAAKEAFLLAPALPPALMQPGRTYGIRNLHFRGTRNEVRYQILGGDRLTVRLTSRGARGPIRIRDEAGALIASGPEEVRFEARNGAVYEVAFQ
jgi:hypothetical protein